VQLPLLNAACHNLFVDYLKIVSSSDYETLNDVVTTE
jgi:hypothetical protein